MRGYCETCRAEMNSDDESEWEGECEVCGTDLIGDIHVQEYDSFEEAEEDVFANPFFQRD